MRRKRRPFAFWIGNMSHYKNPLEVIEIARAIPEMDFILIGSPSWERDILSRFEATKTSNVQYLGSIPESFKRKLIQDCSVGITTSKFEGFGWVPLEFLMASKPVLAHPLKSFKEIYGNLVMYANSTSEFIMLLKELYEGGFRAKGNREAIVKLQRKYSYGRAAATILGLAKSRPILILTRDIPMKSDHITGFHLVNWNLWRSMRDNGAELEILADGEKFSTAFRLRDRTTTIARIILSLKAIVTNFRWTTTRGETLNRKILQLVLLAAEPLSFVILYVKKRWNRRQRHVVATGTSPLFAAIVLKLIYNMKVVYVMHDAFFHKYPSETALPIRIYYTIFARCLRYADLILTVSNTVSEDLLEFYPRPEKIMTVWGKR